MHIERSTHQQKKLLLLIDSHILGLSGLSVSIREAFHVKKIDGSFSLGQADLTRPGQPKI